MKVVFEPKVKEHNPILYKADREAVYCNGWSGVDAAAVQQYMDEGYLIVREAFTTEEVKAAREELEMMTLADDPDCESIYYEGSLRQHIENKLQGEENRGDEKSTEGLALGYSGEDLPELDPKIRASYVRKFMGFTASHPSLEQMAKKKQLLALVRQLCDAQEIELFQEMAMIKPPNGREKPWHQDHAYFNNPLETKIVGVWIALSQVTPENGCMYLLPGVQDQGPIPHFMRRDWQICDEDILEQLADRRIAAPMQSGDVLIFDSKLPHGTPKNISDTYRWALQLHYRSVASESCPDEERLANFGSEGKNVTC